MCSSPKGSNESTPNKPRTRGILADMSPSERLNYATKANAADNRRMQRVAREQKIRLREKQQVANVSVATNVVVQPAWYRQLWQFFY